MQFAEGDFAKQAQLTAAQIAKQAQLAGKNAQDGFNRFVEGGNDPQHKAARREAPLDESKKDFWDSFSSLADEQPPRKNSSIGTSVIGMGKKGNATAPGAAQKKNDDWDDW